MFDLIDYAADLDDADVLVAATEGDLDVGLVLDQDFEDAGPFELRW